MLSTVLLYSVFLFALSSLLHHQRRWGSPYNSHDYVLDAVSAIALSFGFVGGHELDRHGHQQVRTNLVLYILLSFGLLSVLIIGGGYSEKWIYAVFALFALPFPVALYLNWNQTKSTSQPTSANAS
jgi:hypothetical protein